MDKVNKKEDKSSWAIGGSLLIGIGVGFFFLNVNPLAFVGCIIIGLGLGLVLAALISKNKS
jgi:hypothetical protein